MIYATCTLDWLCNEASETRASVWLYTFDLGFLEMHEGLVAKEMVGYECRETQQF